MAALVQLNPLLRPEILQWDVSSVHEIAVPRLNKYRATAIIPPSRSMTLMIPGLPFHLAPLHPSREHADYITVSDVLDWIYHCLNTCRLEDAEYSTLFGWQKDTARTACCTRLEVSQDDQTDLFFRENMRRLDLLFGRLHFDGILHQRDANGANVWVVILRDTQKSPSFRHIHRLLEPGHITWDFQDPPPVLNDSDSFGTAGEPMVVVDISGHPFISIPAPPDYKPARLFTPSTVLEAIHAAMNIRVRDDKWPFWDPTAQGIVKAVFQTATAAQRDDIINYLDMLPTERHRFLGLWQNVYSGGRRVYTLLTQPSVRCVPEIHSALRRGSLRWDILSNLSGTGIPVSQGNQPATSPGRGAMDISIEFAPGAWWSHPVFKAKDAQFITVRQLLFSIYRFLVQDEYTTISFKKLPLHLQHRIRARASMMQKTTKSNVVSLQAGPINIVLVTTKPGPKQNRTILLSKDALKQKRRRLEKVFHGFRRVDVLSAVTCSGIEHSIGAMGEDEWKVYLSN